MSTKKRIFPKKTTIKKGMHFLMSKLLTSKGHIKWKCLANNCPQNCCAAKPTNNRYVVVSELSSAYIPLTDKDLKQFKNPKLKKYIFRAKDGYFYLKVNRKGRCMALDENGKCKIYEIRPSSCKAYPFFLDKYGIISIDSLCPGVGKGLSSEKEINIMLKSLLEVYRFNIIKLKKLLSKNE